MGHNYVNKIGPTSRSDFKNKHKAHSALLFNIIINLLGQKEQCFSEYLYVVSIILFIWKKC